MSRAARRIALGTALALCLVRVAGAQLVEAEDAVARDPDDGGFARPFDERWASGRRCVVGFRATGRASWTFAVEAPGERALWLRYASLPGGTVGVGFGALGSLGDAALPRVEVPATGAYAGRDAWGWAELWRGPLPAGAATFTLSGGPLRPDALWLGAPGEAPPDLAPPDPPQRDPALVARVRSALESHRPPAALARDARAPEWYERTRVMVHTRLTPRWREREVFTRAEELLAGVGARAVTRHVRTMGEGAWWPSAVAPSEPWAAEEPVPALVARAREHGLRVIAYYRHLEDRAVVAEHPEWLCRDDLGRTIDTRPVPQACLASPYAEELLTRLLELARRGVDAIYFDEGHMPRGGCFCGSCRALWAEWTDGAPFPDTSDPSDPLVRALGLFTDVVVERFFARARAALRAERPDLALLIGSNRVPDLFDRHLSTHLATFADAVKTEYALGDSPAARDLAARDAAVALPTRGGMLTLGWALSRDSAGGRPPHVWIHGPADAREASAATAAVIAWGGVANLDVREDALPESERLGPALALGNALSDLLAGARPVRRTAVHFPEAGRDTTADDAQAWRDVLAGTYGAWDVLVARGEPCGLVTDDELRAGIGEDVERLVLPAPGALDTEEWRSVVAFLARGGVLLPCAPSPDWADVEGRDRAAADLATALGPRTLPAGCQLVEHRMPDGRTVLCVVRDGAWVFTGRRTLPGGEPVTPPPGVGSAPPALRADEVQRDGFRRALVHDALVVLVPDR